MALPLLRALGCSRRRFHLPSAAAQLHSYVVAASASVPPSLIDLPSISSPSLHLRFSPFSGLPSANLETLRPEEEAKVKKTKIKAARRKSSIFTKVDKSLLPTVIIVGRPNVGKSALFNRLIRRREALVCNTPGDHVTRDVREGVAKLGDLRFWVLDSAGLETAAVSGSILSRTSAMTSNVLARAQFAIFLIDVRDGLQPLDLEVGQWLRRNAPGIKTIVAMNKSESLDVSGRITAEAGEAYALGFGDPVAISAETGLGMAELCETLRPLLEEYMLQLPIEEKVPSDVLSEAEEAKLPLQLAIVGRPNVGKSTLLNALLQEYRVLVGPEAGLTRDSIRAQLQFEGRTIYLVDTAGWLHRSGKVKGPSSLSVVQSKKNLMRAHVVALVLDGQEIAKAKSSLNHDEVIIARQAVEEGRALVVIVNKMDLLQGSDYYQRVLEAVPKEIQSAIPQVTGIPVVFVSALKGRGRMEVIQQVLNAYEKWCSRLTTAQLNRWFRKVISRHSWKDQATQPKIKYLTQVKARPPSIVAFLSGNALLSDANTRFLMKSIVDDFNLGGIPIRITQRVLPKRKGPAASSGGGSGRNPARGKSRIRNRSDKRSTSDGLEPVSS